VAYFLDHPVGYSVQVQANSYYKLLTCTTQSRSAINKLVFWQ